MTTTPRHNTPLTCKAGFSLVELMVTLAVLAIMTGIAIPSVMAWMPDIYLKDQAAEVKAALMKARSLAINGGTEHRVVFNLDTGTFQIDQGDLMVGATNWTTVHGPYNTTGGVGFGTASQDMESAGTNRPFIRFGTNGSVVTNVDQLVLQMTNSKNHIISLNMTRRTGHVAIVKEYMP